MDKNTDNKYFIRIPKNISIIYCENKKIITIIGPLCKKSIKVQIKILFSKDKKTIKISSYPIKKISNKEKKNLKIIKSTTRANIKTSITETTTLFYKKLKLIGVGYKISNSEDFQNYLITLKLGYSHKIYFKVSKTLNFFCIKLTKLFIFGYSLQNVTEEASRIRSFKKPEPYKGKGILFETEKIKLKEGKKV